MAAPDALLAAIRETASSHPELRAVYLFGSRALGGARADSDFDLGVLYRVPRNLRETEALAEQFEQAIGGHVDLADVSRAGAFLALAIVRGERVFCRDATETDQFELYVLSRAGDLLPFERARQAMLLTASG